ncbi:unnamed protein product, partial [Ixodes pacificus]
VRKTCTTVIYEKVWENMKSVSSFSCQEAAAPVVTKLSGKIDPKSLTYAYVSKHLKLSQERSLFSIFLKAYNKTYKDNKEYESRFMIFKNNLERIALFNRLEEGTAHYGLTEFSDLSRKLLLWKHGISLPSDIAKCRALFGGHLPKITPLSLSVGLQTSHGSHPCCTFRRGAAAVRGAGVAVIQGACGSCWAFSTTGNIEGQWFLSRKKLLSLSEQELVDCDHVDSGCEGGYMGQAFKAVIEMGGLETESDYPYKGSDNNCTFNKTESKVHVQSFVGLPQNET